MQKIHVIHENEEWTRPLAAALDARGLPWEDWFLDQGALDLSKAPPELSQDFLVRGMYLVGGGGLLRGLASRIERETEVPVRMSNVPLEAVVLGAGHVIEHYDALKNMFMGARR